MAYRYTVTIVCDAKRPMPDNVMAIVAGVRHCGEYVLGDNSDTGPGAQQADATEPLSVKAATIASEALGSDCLSDVPYPLVREIGALTEREHRTLHTNAWVDDPGSGFSMSQLRRRAGPHGDWEGLPYGGR